MSSYGKVVKNAIVLSILDYSKEVPWRLDALGISKWTMREVDGSILQIKVWGRNNPLPAYFTLKVTENT